MSRKVSPCPEDWARSMLSALAVAEWIVDEA